tara:strand:- start:386 stop:565 length:180 start_codon:yes stop_codon:yes gene_type:complete
MVGILTHETVRQKQLELELKALDLIATHGNTYNKTDVIKRLYEIAFPEKLANKLEQETL